MKVTLREKAFLRRKGKRFTSEGIVIYVYGSKSFRHKFAKKPVVIEGNMNALKRSMQEVKGL